MENKTKKRIFYLDALRALAILSVVCFHAFSCNRYLIEPEIIIPSFNWIATDFVIICLRVGVDLFLILSGALSLGRDWTIKTFLGKRIPRIVLPFIFWGFFLSLLIIATSYIYGFNYITDFSIGNLINFIFNAYLVKSPGFYPYWFFWMILGTYLIMPIFNKWIYHSDLKEIEYFLCIWLITCIFDFTLGISFPIKLSYFVSPIGLVVLGYYLRYTERKLLNNPYFGILLIILSCSIMMVISYILSTPKNFYVFDRYSIFVAMEVIGIYSLFKNFDKLNINLNFLKNENGIFRRFIKTLAKYSYGMYLTHAVFIAILLKLVSVKFFGFKVYIVIILLGGLFLPMIVLNLLNRIPYIKDIIGVK